MNYNFWAEWIASSKEQEAYQFLQELNSSGKAHLGRRSAYAWRSLYIFAVKDPQWFYTLREFDDFCDKYNIKTKTFNFQKTSRFFKLKMKLKNIFSGLGQGQKSF